MKHLPRLPFALAALCAALWACAASFGPVWAAERADVPTRITSDSMRLSPDAATVTFTGKVAVDRPDFKIWADTITVTFAKTPAAAGKAAPAGADNPGFDPNRIETIVAEGSVRLTREGKEGQCRRAVYLLREGLFKMEGDPILKDGKNRIQGEVIKLYLKDNRSEVVGGPTRRVEALFFTPKGAGTP